jgi:hypothetical protein
VGYGMIAMKCDNFAMVGIFEMGWRKKCGHPEPDDRTMGESF